MRLGYTGPVHVFRDRSMLWSLRICAGLTQAELAREVCASRRTISSLERGRSQPSLSLALALARRLDVPVDDLFPDPR
jgi:putative transcriptional regulator